MLKIDNNTADKLCELNHYDIGASKKQNPNS